MKKLMYWIGVYRVCVLIHHFPDALAHGLEAAKYIADELQRIKSKIESIDNPQKEEQPRSGISARSDMVMNRIGF